MKINFKKIATVIGSALLIGSTAGFAAAATFPAPFVQGGSADVAVVIGANAALSDAVAATNIGSVLAGDLAAQTARGATSVVSATGGDSVNLATTSQNLFYNSALNAAKTTLTKTELPTLLADGTTTDSAGTAYTYTQSINLGSRAVAYGTANGNLQDPTLYLDGNTNTSSPLYTYKLTFNKAINVSDSNVIGNDITILGQSFTIGSGSTNSTLNLYGSGQQTTINEGDTANVTIGGVAHKIQVTGITQSGTANVVYVSVDGNSAQRINEGAASNVNGVQIYAKVVFYSGKTGSTNYAALNLGTSVLTLNSGSTVTVGTDSTPIQNTLVTMTSSSGKVSGITIAVAMPDSTKAFILPGGSFTDPIFGGMNVVFADTNPGLNASNRDSVTIDSDGARNLRATFTTALAGTPATLYFLHDGRSDTSTGSADGNLYMADQSNKTIHTTEGDAVGINEYMVINSGDYGRIIKATSIPTGTLSSTSTIQFSDALTGTSIFSGSGLTVGTTGNATTNIDGQPYYFMVTNGSTSTVQVTWGALASYGYVGTQTTVAPKVKLANGEWISFLQTTTLKNATTYVLPGYDALTTYETGQAITCPQDVAAATTSKTYGNIVYNITNVDNSTCTLVGATVGSSYLNATAMREGIVLIQEPKKTTESGNSQDGDAIGIQGLNVGTNTVSIGVNTPKVSGTSSGLNSWTSDSNKQTLIDRYGTMVTYSTANNHNVMVSVPNQQMIADVLFTSTGATVSSSTSGGSATQLGAVTVYDSEISSVQAKNLVVVGGSCINAVAAKILGSATPICGAAFTTATGVGDGQYLIQVAASPYTTGKVAMLVAGYNAADTAKAATYVSNNAVNVSVGNKLKGTTVTDATVVTA